MRPVNLLPEQDRPRASGAGVGSGRRAKGALAVLGILLVAVLGYVLSANQVNDRRGDLAAVEAETQGLQSQVNSLASFDRFAQIKQTRLESVSRVAAGRFDWERLMRELALVLPKDAWISSMDAKTATPTDAAPVAGQPAATPTAAIAGCARGHRGVATVLVRLRKLNGVVEVNLEKSAEAATSAGKSAGSGTAVGASGGGEGGGCGKFNSFSGTIVFSAEAVAEGGLDRGSKVPAALGGGK